MKASQPHGVTLGEFLKLILRMVWRGGERRGEEGIEDQCPWMLVAHRQWG